MSVSDFPTAISPGACWGPTAESRDKGATFCEGHELDGATAAVIPPDAIGRMLSPEEATKLIRKIERAIPKRPAAASAAAKRSRA